VAGIRHTSRRFRLSGRARSSARRIGITLEDAIWVVATSTVKDQDAQGRHRFAGELDGRGVRIVLSRVDPFLIDAIDTRR
jgi:hypothetical protein